MSSKVFVNVLVHDGERWLHRCLSSLEETAPADATILAVDNASTDRSAELVRKDFPRVELLRLDRNLGFAGGHNAGMRRALEARADFVALLNQDVVAEPGWLESLLAAARNHPSFQIFAPMQLDYEGKDLDPTFSRILRQSPLYLEDRDAGRPLRDHYEVPDTFGAAIFLRREALERVGGFDPSFFMYSEESDFFQRARFHGLSTAVVPASRVRHYHVSRNPSRADIPRLAYYPTRNRYLALLKDPNRSFASNLMRWPAILAGDIASDLGKRRPLLRAGARLAIQAEVLLRLPGAWRRRRREMRGPCYL